MEWILEVLVLFCFVQEEVGRGTTVGGRADLQEEVQDAEKPEAGRHGCWQQQEASLKVLPAEDGALSHGTVPPLGQGSVLHSPVRSSWAL